MKRFRSIVSLLLCALLPASAAATDDSPTQSMTPLAMASGQALGSYGVSGLDSVNLFSGNLAFRVPLLHVGGRGSAGYTIGYPIEQHWSVNHSTFPINCGQTGCTGVGGRTLYTCKVKRSALM